MATNQVYVRVNNKTPVQTLARCGYLFGRSWQIVGADAATVKRFNEEQYLEVSLAVPADYAAPVAAQNPVAPAAAKAGAKAASAD
jgi:hypothetical protein